MSCTSVASAKSLGGLVVELVGHLDDVVPRWLTHGHGYVRDGVTAFVTGRHLPYL